MSNSQRVAIITGASQGIGERLVSGYRKLGYAVVANSRTIAESDDPMVLTVSGDIAQPGVGQRIVDTALERFGRVDTVVNNAGIFIPKPFTEYTDNDYDAVTGVNLRGFFEVSRAAVAAMLSREGGGHIVNISTSLVDHANSRVPLGVGVADERRAQRGDQGAGSRIRAAVFAPTPSRSASSGTRCTIRRPTTPWPNCIPSVAWSNRRRRRRSPVPGERRIRNRRNPACPDGGQSRTLKFSVAFWTGEDSQRRAGARARVRRVHRRCHTFRACTRTALGAKASPITTPPNHAA